MKKHYFNQDNNESNFVKIKTKAMKKAVSGKTVKNTKGRRED